MKLSEAIRKGGEGQKQYTGNYYSEDGSMCALGAAGHTLGLSAFSFGRIDISDALRNEWPELYDVRIDPEGHGEYFFPPEDRLPMLQEVIVQLNDTEEWTFEQIANWLEERGY